MAYKKLSLFRTPPEYNADYYEHSSINLPPGKRNGVMPKIYRPDSLWLNKGCYYVGVNENTDLTQYSQQSGTSIDHIAQFTANPAWLRDYRPQKHFNEWTQDEVKGAVNFQEARFGSLPGLWLIASEAYDDSYYWRPAADYAYQQTKWLVEAVGAKQDAKGYLFGGDYGGTIDLQNFLDLGRQEEMIPILNAGPDAMLQKYKELEAPWSQYFKMRGWENYEMTVDTYWLTRRTPYQFVFKILLSLTMAKMAMQANEVSRKRKIISYYMPEGIQSFDYTSIFRKRPVTGGTIDSVAFPIESYGSHVALGAMEWMFVDVRQQWSDAIRYGTNLDVININDPSTNFVPNGGYYENIGDQREYTPGGKSAVRATPYGNNNGSDDGARWYGLATQWTGTQNWEPCRYRNASGSGSYTTNDAASLVRNYQNGDPFVYKSVGVNGRKAIMGYTNDGDFKNYQFDMGNSTFTPADKDMPVPGSPFCYLVD